MTFGGRKASFLLFVGDILVFAFSLWVTLFLRYGGLPSVDLLRDHFVPFSALFVIWAVVFYMAGLYGKRVVLFSQKLPSAILRTQLFNIVLAALFFFLFSGFGVTPKTNLAIYLFVSLIFIFAWRLGIFPKVTVPTTRLSAALIGSGPEVEELVKEVNGNKRYYLEFKVVISPEDVMKEGEKAFSERLLQKKVSVVVVDAENDVARPLLPIIYDLTLIGRKCQFADFYTVYEEVFDRVPLSLLRFEWFLKNISSGSTRYYTLSKRVADIIGGLLMGVVTLVIAPFIWVAMRFEGKGSLFLVQERIGMHGARIRAYKFRSMTSNNSASGEWVGEEKDRNRITKVGGFLRLTSLDEFPQCINILKGELSLIGPRNDIEGLGKRLAEAIPYYNIRYVVKPGITGWAQINQQYEQGNISPQSIEETKTRLAYDFYYIKNRSVALDIIIALKTVKRMLFRVSNL